MTRVAYLGNFAAPWCTEVHVAASLAALGHEVVRIQEGETPALAVPARAAECDLFLWTQTYGLAARSSIPARQQMLGELRAAGIPSAGFHLDRWWGLSREDQIATEPFFRVDKLFTADGGHDEQWAAQGIDHVWSPPAVFHAECAPGTPTPRYNRDLCFVGNWRGSYHPEWRHRYDLVRHLQMRYHRRCGFYPVKASQQIRGTRLNHLYATVRIVVGDSCLVGDATRYFSDRIPETLGRGGFLLHPYVEGIEHLFTDGKHLRFFPAGDFDELDRLVSYYLEHDDERRQIAEEGRRHVLEHHTYVHRMDALLTAMQPQPATWAGEIRDESPDAITLNEIYGEDVYRARGHIEPESLVLDLGANVGVFSIWAAQLGANVVACEPAGQNLEQLDRNVRAHDLEGQVTVLPVAVGASDGWGRMMPLDMTPENSVEAWLQTMPEQVGDAVPIVSLDSLFADVGSGADVLKIDVEGAEYEIIAGASLDTLRRVRFITIEFHGGPMTHRPAPAGSFGAMIEKLAEVFSLEIIGLPSNGGYVYGRRHSD